MSNMDIHLIKDPTNPILTQREQPPPTTLFVYYEGTKVLVNPMRDQIVVLILS